MTHQELETHKRKYTDHETLENIAQQIRRLSQHYQEECALINSPDTIGEGEALFKLFEKKWSAQGLTAHSKNCAAYAKKLTDDMHMLATYKQSLLAHIDSWKDKADQTILVYSAHQIIAECEKLLNGLTFIKWCLEVTSYRAQLETTSMQYIDEMNVFTDENAGWPDEADALRLILQKKALLMPTNAEKMRWLESYSERLNNYLKTLTDCSLKVQECPLSVMLAFNLRLQEEFDTKKSKLTFIRDQIPFIRICLLLGENTESTLEKLAFCPELKLTTRPDDWADEVKLLESQETSSEFNALLERIVNKNTSYGCLYPFTEYCQSLIAFKELFDNALAGLKDFTPSSEMQQCVINTAQSIQNDILYRLIDYVSISPQYRAELRKKKKAADLNQKFAAQQSHIDTLKSITQKLDGKIGEVGNTIHTLENKYNALNRSYDSLQSNLNSIQYSINTVDSKIRKLEQRPF